MEGKKKNIFIGILGVTTVVAAGVAVYLGLKYNSSRVEIARLQEVVNEPKQTEIVEKEKVVTEYAIPKISNENCLNPEEGFSYCGWEYQYCEAYGTQIFKDYFDSKILHLRIDKEKLEKSIPSLTLNNVNEAGYFSHEYTFNSDIVQIYVGGCGIARKDQNKIFCLLDDGYVYCLNLDDAIKNDNFDNFIKLDEISDIIQVGYLDIHPKAVSQLYSVYATRNDGKFYDLREILRNRGLI